MSKQRMEMPTRVRVGAALYTVIHDESYLGARNYAGETRDYDCTINVSQKMNVERQRETFWHELTHASSMETLSNTNKLKEQQVKAVATTLLRMMQDHPDVVAFVTGFRVSHGKEVAMAHKSGAKSYPAKPGHPGKGAAKGKKGKRR